MKTLNFCSEDFCCRCGCGLEAEDALILAMQDVRDEWGQPMHVNSGARCQPHNFMIGGAPHSAHLEGLAADIADPEGELAEWIEPKLAAFGLWMEAPEGTIGWCHLQLRQAHRRVFRP